MFNEWKSYLGLMLWINFVIEAFDKIPEMSCASQSVMNKVGICWIIVGKS